MPRPPEGPEHMLARGSEQAIGRWRSQALANLLAQDIMGCEPDVDSVVGRHTLSCRLLALPTARLTSLHDQFGPEPRAGNGPRNRLQNVDELGRGLRCPTANEILSCKSCTVGLGPMCLQEGCRWCEANVLRRADDDDDDDDEGGSVSEDDDDDDESGKGGSSTKGNHKGGSSRGGSGSGSGGSGSGGGGSGSGGKRSRDRHGGRLPLPPKKRLPLPPKKRARPEPCETTTLLNASAGERSTAAVDSLQLIVDRVQPPPQPTQVRYLIDTHGCCVTQQCGARTHHLSH